MQSLSDIPSPLRDVAARAWSAIESPPDAGKLPGVARVLACSEFIAKSCAGDPRLLHRLVERGWDAPMTRAGFDAASTAALEPCETDEDAGAALRRFRREESVRIAWRDLAGLAPLETSLAELSSLAEACITAAYARVEAGMHERYGTPRGANGDPQSLVVLAMGKLGAFELNFSSDVDLVFAYPENGDTDGARSISNEEYFTRFGRNLIRFLDEVTADGFVHRVDMRLRPFGDSGPLALSFGAMESYYQEHGRDWERYALVKARPVAGDARAGARLLDMLRPFVYRRYLDYGSFEQLRRMKAMIRQEVTRRELADNVKLGPGGIREVEFVGQAYQLIRGGREPALQERSILRVLELLGTRRHLAADAASELKAAYCWLRQVENRMQAQQDRQVHALPEDGLARMRLACAMGFDEWDAFRAEFDAVRARVNRHFESVFFGPQHDEVSPAGAGAVWGSEDDDAAAGLLADAGFTEPLQVLQQLAQIRDSAWFRMLGDTGRARLDQLIPLLIAAAAAYDNADATLQRCLRIVEAIDRRIAYLSLLIENPTALEHLARLCSASRMVAERVAHSPLLLDELLDARIFNEPPTREEFGQELERMLEGIADEDLERQMDALRAFQQAAVLRVAVADVVGLLPVMRVSDLLTDIAEICLAHALELAWSQLVAKHGEPGCGFGIVAYGKLGGLELGYGSDLDLVFLHDSGGDGQVTDGDKPVDVAVFFARLGQRIVHLLSTPTAAGVLYQVDTRLRPSGASGLLVSSLASFESYQREEAWTWEHQALLRARPVAGSAAVAEAFGRIRRDVLARERDSDTLREAVAEMRARMRREGTAQLRGADTAGRFDLKSGEGGISDIEFIVQYLVLCHAHAHPGLLRWTDNIRQLDGLVEAGILGGDEGKMLADAYRALRERVHRLTLKGEDALVDDGEFTEERELVKQLWREHLGEV